MIAGEIYQAMGRELFDERQYAKEQLHTFNNLAPSKIKARTQILKTLFGETSNLFFI